MFGSHHRERRYSYFTVLVALLFLVPVLPALAAHQEGRAQRDLYRRDEQGPALRAHLEGRVQSGKGSLGYADVTLYRAGISGPAEILGRTVSDRYGRFEIRYKPPIEDDAVLYLIADVLHGNRMIRHRMIRLATVLGTSPVGAPVVINERTTVATAFAMAQFIAGADISGKNPGLENAASMSHDLVNIEDGDVGSVLENSPNGGETTAMAEFNSLSNMIAECIRSPGRCSTLFSLSPDFQGRPARDTLQAMINIAHDPANNNETLFDFSQDYPFYQPALSEDEVPDAWTIALRFTDQALDGPGNIAFDRHGNIWVNNNYFNSTDSTKVCGDNHMFAFRPDGSEFPGSPFGGVDNNGGLFGAGYGIGFDTKNNLWISNYGFTGSECDLGPRTVKLMSRSVSEFDPEGNALSPSTPPSPPPFGGWRSRRANILKPQGMASDKNGNMWITSCGNDSLVELENGNIGEVKRYPNPTHRFKLRKPFDVAIDTQGNIWVDSNANRGLFAIRPDGTVLHRIHNRRIVRPMGIATDQSGNVWIADSGIVDVPCQEGESDTDTIPSEDATSEHRFRGASAGLYMNGTMHFYTGGGIFLPWGIAVDGNNNVWIANFGGPSSGLVGVSELCGASGNCPPGKALGDPISPSTGYTSNGLTRVTSVEIDASGNVWLANNWLRGDPHDIEENPGGHQVVVFLGLAGPVKGPLIGPPQRP